MITEYKKGPVKREVLPSLVTLLILLFIDLCVFVCVEEGLLRLIINKLFGIVGTEERTDGQTDGQMEGRADKRRDGRTDK